MTVTNDKAEDPNPEVSPKVNDVVLRLARLIGRQIAREQFERARAQEHKQLPRSKRGKLR